MHSGGGTAIHVVAKTGAGSCCSALGMMKYVLQVVKVGNRRRIVQTSSHLLQGRDKGLELGSGVLHKEQAREGEVEGGAAAAVGCVVQEGKVLRGVVLQDVGREVQLQQQLAARVAGRQILHIMLMPFQPSWSDSLHSHSCSLSLVRLGQDQHLQERLPDTQLVQPTHKVGNMERSRF